MWGGGECNPSKNPYWFTCEKRKGLYFDSESFACKCRNANLQFSWSEQMCTESEKTILEPTVNDSSSVSQPKVNNTATDKNLTMASDRKVGVDFLTENDGNLNSSINSTDGYKHMDNIVKNTAAEIRSPNLTHYQRLNATNTISTANDAKYSSKNQTERFPAVTTTDITGNEEAAGLSNSTNVITETISKPISNLNVPYPDITTPTNDLVKPTAKSASNNNHTETDFNGNDEEVLGKNYSTETSAQSEAIYILANTTHEKHTTPDDVVKETENSASDVVDGELTKTGGDDNKEFSTHSAEPRAKAVNITTIVAQTTHSHQKSNNLHQQINQNNIATANRNSVSAYYGDGIKLNLDKEIKEIVRLADSIKTKSGVQTINIIVNITHMNQLTSDGTGKQSFLMSMCNVNNLKHRWMWSVC